MILGACNPPLAHRALSADPEIGLLLPCNVTVRQAGGHTVVQAVDPALLLSLTSSPRHGRVTRARRGRPGRFHAIERRTRHADPRALSRIRHPASPRLVGGGTRAPRQWESGRWESKSRS